MVTVGDESEDEGDALRGARLQTDVLEVGQGALQVGSEEQETTLGANGCNLVVLTQVGICGSETTHVSSENCRFREFKLAVSKNQETKATFLKLCELLDGDERLLTKYMEPQSVSKQKPH